MKKLIIRIPFKEIELTDEDIDVIGQIVLVLGIQFKSRIDEIKIELDNIN